MSALRDYYRLAKPGIIYGNLLTTIAAFLFVCAWRVQPGVFIATVLGLGFVIGSGCVFNNYFDRGIDTRMERTSGRPLAAGRISPQAALAYGAILGILGFALLLIYVNLLAACVAAVGFLSYVAMYTPAKHHTSWAALIGSVPGATPIVVGYVAATGRFDLPALLLFLILVFWQMPHFYAIALYRLEEYRAAAVPVFPLRHGIPATKRHIIGFTFLFAVAAILFASVGNAGISYLVLMLAAGLAWLWQAFRGYRLPDPDGALWARRLFRLSLLVLLVFCLALAAAPFLP